MALLGSKAWAERIDHRLWEISRKLRELTALLPGPAEDARIARVNDLLELARCTTTPIHEARIAAHAAVCMMKVEEMEVSMKGTAEFRKAAALLFQEYCELVLAMMGDG
jgi:hypothetical protein